MRFIGADMPEVSDLTLGIMALVAEQEVKAVSRRTRDALPRPGHNWVSDIAKDMHVESHDMLIREAVRKALSADWPVNCAGINVLQPFLAVTVASFHLVQAVNPRAALSGAQAFARSCIAESLGGAVWRPSAPLSYRVERRARTCRKTSLRRGTGKRGDIATGTAPSRPMPPDAGSVKD